MKRFEKFSQAYSNWISIYITKGELFKEFTLYLSIEHYAYLLKRT